MDILDFFWTFYLNHLSPLWGYFWLMANQVSFLSDGWWIKHPFTQEGSMIGAWYHWSFVEDYLRIFLKNFGNWPLFEKLDVKVKIVTFSLGVGGSNVQLHHEGLMIGFNVNWWFVKDRRASKGALKFFQWLTVLCENGHFSQILHFCLHFGCDFKGLKMGLGGQISYQLSI